MNSIVNGYGLNGMGSAAVELFHQMPEVLHDERTYVCVLNACSHSGLVASARLIFDRIENKTERIVTTMVSTLFFLGHNTVLGKVSFVFLSHM